jgi:prepilin-type N-terminal cleavage/methylation domain-containing protein
MIKIKKGFTLVELLVVIAIIGMLSTIAVVSLGQARLKARDAKRIADMRQVGAALEIYYSDQSAYPTFSSGNGATINGDCISSTNGIAATCAGTTYMAVVPTYPTVSGGTTTCGSNAVNNYCAVSTATAYTIKYLLESGTSWPGGAAANTHCVMTNTGTTCDNAS